MLLQSMDFLNLYRDHGVTLQHGATDQWGNITAGVELIRRADGGQAHAFVTPLITKPDGTKYGKTEGDALWLDAEMMSPYAFHQWWLNVDDSPGRRAAAGCSPSCPTSEIEAVEARDRGTKPWLRAGQKRLADEVTTFVHGAAGDRGRQGGRGGAVRRRRPPRPEPVDAVGGTARGRLDLGAVAAPGRRPARRDAAWPRARARPAGPSPRAAPTSTTCASRIPTPSRRPADLIGGSWLVLRRGKKSFAGVEVG